MHPETLYQNTQTTLESIKDLPWLQKFYLAGGTALALQLGHRKSIYLDFFIRHFPPHQEILAALAPFQPEPTQINPGTLDVIINHTKVSFLEYDYELLDEFVSYQNLALAGIRDIASMKLSTISSRGAKKDFVDLYFILQKFSLAEIFDLMSQKFVNINYDPALFLRSLTYFVDAEDDLMPEMLSPVSWEQIKSEVQQQALAYAHKQLG